jgi:uncharacterized RDD family membrane protein YckC
MSMQPGWYPDPFSSGGYVRWWDGQRWGASTSVGVGTDPSAPPSPPPPPAPAPGAVAPLAPGSDAPLATWRSRALARIIDALIEGVLSLPFVLWLIWPALQKFFEAMPADGSPPSAAATATFQSEVLAVSIPLTVVSVVVTFLYQVPQNVAWGRTLGKRVLGIRIRSFAHDGTPGWGQSTVRWGTYTVGTLLTNGLFAVVDYLWPLWDKPWRQALHDKTARTLVVVERR